LLTKTAAGAEFNEALAAQRINSLDCTVLTPTGATG
jgi:hypothetical protein